MTIQNQGLSIVSVVDPDHPEYDSYLDWQKDLRASLPRLINESLDRLEALVAPLPAFAALAYYQLHSMAGGSGEDPVADIGASLLAGMETIGAIVARRPNGQATAPPEQLAEISPHAIDEEIQRLLTLEIWAALEQAERADPGDDLAALRSQASAVRVSVRGPSYPWQERETLQALFEPDQVQEDLQQTLGATVEECLRIEKTSERIGTKQFESRIKQVDEAADRLLQAVAARRRGQNVRDSATRSLADRLAALPSREAEEEVRRWAMAVAGTQAGDALSFTAEDLAEQAQVDLAIATRVLDQLSLDFGVSDDLRRVREEFRIRPLLKDQKRYFCVSHHQMLWGLRPVLEAALKERDRFQRYERHRSRLVEQRARKALSSALRPDVAIPSFEYSTDEGKSWTECDGLLIIDQTAVLLEVKAASMRASAKRAAPSSWRQWLEDEIGGGAQQARRARDALAGPDVRIRGQDGEPVELELDGIERWLEVVVTLEDLPTLAPATWQLADAGVLPSGPIPWIIGLHELEVIVDLVEWPGQFVHYLLRRQRMDEQRATWAIEELDLFIYYLERGLFWDPAPESLGPPRMIAPATDGLDNYLYFRQGLLPRKAKKPRQRIHRSVRALLDSLDRLDATGRLEPQLFLLDVDSAAAERIATACGQLKRDAARRGATRDLTLLFEGVGVTVMACPPSGRDQLPLDLKGYCMLKKHQAKCDRWIGFGCFSGPPEPAQLAVVFSSPWEPDSELDALVAELPTEQSGEPPPAAPGKTRWWREGRWRD